MLAARHPPALRQGKRDGQAVLLRGRPVGGQRGRADPRRLRPDEGIRRGALLPRPAPTADRRGHLGDPAPGDQPVDRLLRSATQPQP